MGGLAAIFDLAAFRQAMIAPVKKSVNHSKTVTSMREIGMIRADSCHFVRADSTVENGSHLANVYLLLVCFFCGSTKFEHDYLKSRPIE